MRIRASPRAGFLKKSQVAGADKLKPAAKPPAADGPTQRQLAMQALQGTLKEG